MQQLLLLIKTNV